MPITISLTAATAVSGLAPTLGSARLLIPVLIVGMPTFAALFAPALALLSKGAHRLRLDQGLAFGLANLAWARWPGHFGRGKRGGGPGDVGPVPVLPAGGGPPDHSGRRACAAEEKGAAAEPTHHGGSR